MEKEEGAQVKNQLKVKIRFCGGWGYRKYALMAKNTIKGAHPLAKFKLSKDKKTTGALEVLVNSKHLIYSKLSGDGYFTLKKKALLLERLQNCLKL